MSQSPPSRIPGQSLDSGADDAMKAAGNDAILGSKQGRRECRDGKNERRTGREAVTAILVQLALLKFTYHLPGLTSQAGRTEGVRVES